DPKESTEKTFPEEEQYTQVIRHEGPVHHGQADIHVQEEEARMLLALKIDHAVQDDQQEADSDKGQKQGGESVNIKGYIQSPCGKGKYLIKALRPEKAYRKKKVGRSRRQAQDQP